MGKDVGGGTSLKVLIGALLLTGELESDKSSEVSEACNGRRLL